MHGQHEGIERILDPGRLPLSADSGAFPLCGRLPLHHLVSVRQPHPTANDFILIITCTLNCKRHFILKSGVSLFVVVIHTLLPQFIPL